jgi:hypothetical protein
MVMRITRSIYHPHAVLPPSDRTCCCSEIKNVDGWERAATHEQRCTAINALVDAGHTGTACGTMTTSQPTRDRKTPAHQRLGPVDLSRSSCRQPGVGQPSCAGRSEQRSIVAVHPQLGGQAGGHRVPDFHDAEVISRCGVQRPGPGHALDTALVPAEHRFIGSTRSA